MKKLKRTARAAAQPRPERPGPLAAGRARRHRSCCCSCSPRRPATGTSSGRRSGPSCSRPAPRKPSCGARSRPRRARPPTCRPTRTSSPRWRSRSAPCCASCRTRPRCRTCWSTSRRPASPPGLEEKLFQPQGENRKDFYAELPIAIRLTGTYHELGNFVSGIAALPRIVTLHDIEIVPAGAPMRAAGVPGDLTLNVTAKTYRYLDEDEQAPAERHGDQKGNERSPQAKAEAAMAEAPLHMTTTKRIALAAAVLAVLAGCARRHRRAPRQDRGGQEPARRAHRAAAGGEAVRDVRLRGAGPALAVRGRRAGVGRLARTRCGPTSNRPREFLEQFSLDTLRMVGTLRLGGTQLRPGADQGRAGPPGAARQPSRPERWPDHGHRGRQDLAHRDRPGRHGRLHRAARRTRAERMISKETRA